MDTEVKELLAIAFLVPLLEQSPCIAIGDLLVVITSIQPILEKLGRQFMAI